MSTCSDSARVRFLHVQSSIYDSALKMSKQDEWHMTESLELIKFHDNERQWKKENEYTTLRTTCSRITTYWTTVCTHTGFRHYKSSLSKNALKKFFRRNFKKECQDWETGQKKWKKTPFFSPFFSIRQLGLFPKATSRVFHDFLFMSFWNF